MSEPSPDVDLDALFDADYLAFYAQDLDDDTNDDEAALVQELLQLQPHTRVLDLPCGHGRIARRLAASGADVVGVDRSAAFLDVARREAEAHGVTVDYRQGDMHTLAFAGEFDVVVNWFTSFGYADDARLQDALARMRRALRPGGRLLLETLNPFACELLPHDHVRELDDGGHDLMVDRSHFDPIDGRLHVRRLIARSGEATREIDYRIRLFTFPELRDWLLRCGFDDVQGYGADGEVLRADSRRMIVVARDGTHS